MRVCTFNFRPTLILSYFLVAVFANKFINKIHHQNSDLQAIGNQNLPFGEKNTQSE